MRLASAIVLNAYGTSQGVSKAWDTRGRGRAPRPTVPHLNRSKLAKANYVPVTSEKIRNAGESVRLLAAALEATPTPDHHPFDILYKGTKIGIEVKRFEPGRKNLKATIHSGEAGEGSKERKVEFADKSGMKRMYLVVHDMHDPNNEQWFMRRVGDKDDPRSDPNDPRTGWSYNTYAMRGGSLQDMKRWLK